MAWLIPAAALAFSMFSKNDSSEGFQRERQHQESLIQALKTQAAENKELTEKMMDKLNKYHEEKLQSLLKDQEAKQALLESNHKEEMKRYQAQIELLNKSVEKLKASSFADVNGDPSKFKIAKKAFHKAFLSELPKILLSLSDNFLMHGSLLGKSTSRSSVTFLWGNLRCSTDCLVWHFLLALITQQCMSKASASFQTL